MLDLMSVNRDEGPLPLYLHGVTRILRDMRMVQQETRGTFNYREFKRQVLDMTLTQSQVAPLNQRLDTIESFMVKEQTSLTIETKKKGVRPSKVRGNDWTHKVSPPPLPPSAS